MIIIAFVKKKLPIKISKNILKVNKLKVTSNQLEVKTLDVNNFKFLSFCLFLIIKINKTNYKILI